MTASRQPPVQEHVIRCDLGSELLRSTGSLRLRATGWSMLPTVWPGDSLVIEQTDGDEISEGDIVLFRTERGFVAHRVVAKRNVDGNSRIVTRGDSACRADSPISDRDVLGKIAFIMRNGRLIVPARNLKFPSRVFSGLARRSEIVGRVVVGVHGFLQEPSNQNAKDGAVPCQS